ncbi:glycosyltransferase [Azospirillum brasilense]|uniref:glycosyltransferase n=1 Tax=Azospirillum brasilense TaxID=192 RepID=UPI0003A50BAA|nr:glycosyltransferase [Azospirillum brasilense]
MSEAQTPRTLDTGAQERPRETPWETPVVAVVVTHNRLALLKTCLAAIHGQEPRPDRIVVVDNGSSDGTAEWLAEQRVVMPELLVVRQANIGSAGAYHTAFETALGFGARWIWSTDDDGIPQPGALAELLVQAKHHGLSMVGPLVLAAEDRSTLAFPMQGTRDPDSLMARAVDGLAPGTIALFNGTLIGRAVFERIGNVKREMFIWGDEYEFTLRARRAGLKVGTAVKALHIHPGMSRTEHKVLGGRLGTVETMRADRAPHFFRNMGYIHATYEKAGVIPRMIAKYTAHYLVNRDFRGLRVFLDSYLSGLRDEYPEELKRPPVRLPLPERPRAASSSSSEVA